MIFSVFITEHPRNPILIKNFSTFNMETYHKHGTAYTDLFKIEMKKLFLESKMDLAIERILLHLKYLQTAIGFQLSHETLQPFMQSLFDEACLVQDSEYEDFISLFLREVERHSKSDKDFEMEPRFPRYVFSAAQGMSSNSSYVFSQKIYMTIGRLALVIEMAAR